MAKIWYDGYRVSIDENLKMYNPWSIVNFLHHKKIANYWEESGSIDFFKDLFKIDPIKEKIQSLLNQEDTEARLDLKFSTENFMTLKSLMSASADYKVEESTVDLFCSYIFAAGYLTLAEKQKNASTASIKIPNQEVKIELEKKLVSHYSRVFKIKSKLFENATSELELIFNDSTDNTTALKLSLDKLFMEFPEFVDINTGVSGYHGNEDLLHSVINYVALQMKSISKFGTEIWYENKARADIILIDDKKK